MPDAAEILGLVRLLDDLEDLRIAVDALDEGVVGRLAEAPSDRHQIVEREVLVAEHDDDVLEEGAMDLRPGLVAEAALEIDPADLGADRPARAGCTSIAS